MRLSLDTTARMIQYVAGRSARPGGYMSHVGGISPRFLLVLGAIVLAGLTSLAAPAAAQSIAPALQQSVPVAGSATAANPSATALSSVSASTMGASIRAPQASAKEGHSAADVASADKPVLKGLDEATVRKLNPAMMRALRQFRSASASFPAFCRDWERKLRDRERNNLAHIDWRMLGGTETGSYIGYSPVDSCVCKQASNGVPIGELTYKEFSYVVTGKSAADARLSAPKASRVVPTREIFSWDKGKWYY
jgi:hypothetical protein